MTDTRTIPASSAGSFSAKVAGLDRYLRSRVRGRVTAMLRGLGRLAIMLGGRLLPAGIRLNAPDVRAAIRTCCASPGVPADAAATLANEARISTPQRSVGVLGVPRNKEMVAAGDMPRAVPRACDGEEEVPA